MKAILLFVLVNIVFTQLQINPDIIDLSKQNFLNTTGFPLPSTKDLGNATYNWFIIFYSPLCPHCIRTMPSWNDLATDIKTNPINQTKIAKVDCIKNGDLCRQFQVAGYPTIKLLTKTNEKKVFKGDRTVEGYKKFLTQVYSGEIATVPANQPQQSGTIFQIKNFFESLTWVGMLMLVIMVVLIGMLIYVIFDKDEAQQFNLVGTVQKQRQLTEL